MGALGALGVGLSVLFGLFLVVLAAEIYYMLCKRVGRAVGSGGSGSSSRGRRVGDLYAAEEAAAAAEMVGAAGSCGGAYAREAALVGSFGGYPAARPDFAAKFFPPSVEAAPHTRLLFTIAEETKEEMELHKGAAAAAAATPIVAISSSPPPAAAAPLMAAADATGSSPPAASAALSRSASVGSSVSSLKPTPFATPRSSPSVSASPSPSWATDSPLTAASHFSYSPVSTPSPMTAASRFSTATSSPASNASSPQVSRRPSTSAAAYFAAESPSIIHGPLGALFRRPSPPPPQQHLLPLPLLGSRLSDFRLAYPFSPPLAARSSISSSNSFANSPADTTSLFPSFAGSPPASLHASRDELQR